MVALPLNDANILSPLLPEVPVSNTMEKAGLCIQKIVIADLLYSQHSLKCRKLYGRGLSVCIYWQAGFIEGVI